MKDTERRRKDEGINILICEDKHLVHYFLEPDDLTQVNTVRYFKGYDAIVLLLEQVEFGESALFGFGRGTSTRRWQRSRV